MVFFNSIPDHRRTEFGHFVHPLSDILFLNLIAKACGCIGRPDVIAFGKANLKKIRKLGFCHRGIPSESTLCRIDKELDPVKMEDAFQCFTKKFLVNPKTLKIMALDGKCTNGTTQENGRSPDLLSLYSVDKKMTIAKEMCDAKSNEITAAPKLLDKVELDGCLITADAIFCQTAILEKIISKNCDFLVEVKANQKNLRWSMEDRLKTVACNDFYVSEPELSHGRIETRQCRTFNGAAVVVDTNKWGNNLIVIELETTNIDKATKKETCEKRIYISNKWYSAQEFDTLIRKHWGIETNHWHLDYNMKQDDIKRKSSNAARNLDTIQRLVLNMFSVWSHCRKKLADRNLGVAELLRRCKNNFSFLKQILTQK